MAFTDTTTALLETLYYYVHASAPIKATLATNVLECVDIHLKDCSGVDLIVTTYRDVLVELMEKEIDRDNCTELPIVLSKIKNNAVFQSDSKMCDDLIRILDISGPANHKRLRQLELSLRNYVIWTKANKAVRNINNKSYQFSRTSDSRQQDILLSEILQKAKEILEAYESTAGKHREGPDTFIDVSDKASVCKALDYWRNRSKSHRLKFGLQGLNAMFAGGACQGEFLAFGALSHMYKTGILTDCARWWCIHNKPNAPAGCIPTILVVNLENSAESSLQKYYYRAYCNLYRREPKGLTDTEIFDFVQAVYHKNGFRLLVARKEGSEFGFEEYKKLIQDLEKDGFYIVAAIIDYMQLMKLDTKNNALLRANAMQNLFEAMRDFAGIKGITTATGVQLNPEAAMIAYSGKPYVAKHFHQGCMGDSKGIFRAIDTFVFQHIEKDAQGRFCLTWSLGKRREEEPPVAVEDQFVAYRFDDRLGILDDLNGKYTGIKDLFAIDETYDDDDTPSDSF